MRGRPATGRDPVSAIRLPAELTAAIDEWAARNETASRSDAIRRLVELGISVYEIAQAEHTLEHFYLDLMKKTPTSQDS